MAKFYGSVAGYDKNGKRSTDANRQGTWSVEAAARSWVGSVSIELYYAGDQKETKENLNIRVRYEWDASTSHPSYTCFEGKLSDFVDVLSNYTGDQD